MLNKNAATPLCEEEILAKKQGKGTFVLNPLNIGYNRLDRRKMWSV